MPTIVQRTVDLAYAGHPLPEIASALAIDQAAVKATLQDITKVPTGGAAPASVNQRAIDLAYAGHQVPEIASVLDLSEAAVRGLLGDVAQNRTPPSSGAQASSPAVVSGVAQQDASGLPSVVYVAITGGAAGTVKVDIGPTNAVVQTIIPVGDGTISRTVEFRLPATWWFKVTVGGAAAIASAKQISG